MTGWDDELQAALDGQLERLWRDVAAHREAVTLADGLAGAVAGGKRLRPRLLAGVHEGLGGRRSEAMLDAAAAIELLHTAFVVHDDLIDGDHLRRGQLSVPGRYRTEAVAQGAGPRGTDAYTVAGAVLTGDLALTAALRALALLPTPAPVRERVLDRVTRALTTSAVGELADVRFSFGRAWPDDEEVLELAYRKTAAYSFVLPMQVGALLADADDSIVDRLDPAGRSLGVAFQLTDDLAGMFEDADLTGKEGLADLREGKLTLLVSHARGTAAWPRIERCWGQPHVTADDLRDVRLALEETGVRAYVEKVAAEHLRHGLDQVMEAGLGGSVSSWLASLLDRRAVAAA